MVILDQKSPTAEEERKGFHWSFHCIQSDRDWREREPTREEWAREQVLERLVKEYP